MGGRGSRRGHEELTAQGGAQHVTLHTSQSCRSSEDAPRVKRPDTGEKDIFIHVSNKGLPPTYAKN